MKLNEQVLNTFTATKKIVQYDFPRARWRFD